LDAIHDPDYCSIQGLIFGAAHGQTMKSYDVASEPDRYEKVVDPFEMERIKRVKMKVCTLERPGIWYWVRQWGRPFFV